MKVEPIEFLGWNCLELKTGHLTLRVTQSVGPRIIYLAAPGGRNLLAEVPDFFIPPPIGPFRTLGGHRLWHGPEMEARSYLPDDVDPVEATVLADGVRLAQVTDVAGIQKTIEVHLAADRPQVTVVQSLRNDGPWPVETYPWGLTQVRPGGFAILPQWADPLDRYGLVCNRSLAIWPYTRINDPRLRLGDRYILVRADSALSDSFKIGYANRRGWLAYFIDKTLFVKVVPYQLQRTYPDMGSSNEIYTNNLFLELEVMAPLSVVEPGASVSLTEEWHLFHDVAVEPDEDSVDRIVQQLGLDDL